MDDHMLIIMVVLFALIGVEVSGVWSNGGHGDFTKLKSHVNVDVMFSFTVAVRTT